MPSLCGRHSSNASRAPIHIADAALLSPVLTPFVQILPLAASQSMSQMRHLQCIPFRDRWASGRLRRTLKSRSWWRTVMFRFWWRIIPRWRASVSITSRPPMWPRVILAGPSNLHRQMEIRLPGKAQACLASARSSKLDFDEASSLSSSTGCC